MQSTISVLLISEDSPARECLREHFEAIGYRVEIVGRSVDVKRWLRDNRSPAIAILDCEASQDGWDGTYRNLAADFFDRSIPVIALLQPENETISNAYQWAQDFVVKPFIISELLARVRSVLPRIRYWNDTILRVGDVKLDRACRRVRRANRDIELSATDFHLLEFLLRAPGKVFSRKELVDGVWDGNVALDIRTVDVHIGRLRKALKIRNRTSPLRTVRGVGYAVDALSAPATGASRWFRIATEPEPSRTSVVTRNQVGGRSILGWSEQSD